MTHNKEFIRANMVKFLLKINFTMRIQNYNPEEFHNQKTTKVGNIGIMTIKDLITLIN